MVLRDGWIHWRALLRSSWAAVPLLAVFAALALSAAGTKSIAYDEQFHLAGGYSYWLTDDYRIHPTNGNLVQRWLTLPFLLSRPRFPDRDEEAWRYPNVLGQKVAEQFCHDVGNDVDALLWQARAVNAVLGVMLAWVVFAWSRRLFDWRGGLVSLTLYCFCPTLLAHSALVTSDVAAALFFTLAVAGVWAVLHRVNAARLLLSTLAAGALLLTKFSALLLVPMAGLLVAVRLARGKPLTVSWLGSNYTVSGRLRQGLVFTALALVQAAGVWVQVWACYGFRFSAYAEVAPIQPDVAWSELLDEPGPVSPVLRTALESRLLPEAYLYGQAHTLRFARYRLGYLNGRLSWSGWWYYFPYAFAVKSPLPFLGVLALAAATLLKRRGQPTVRPPLSPVLGREGLGVRGEVTGQATSPLTPNPSPPKRGRGERRGRRVWGWRLYRTAPLWALVGVYAVAAVRSHLNIGLRHLLPLFPPLFILAGAAAGWFRRATWRTAGALALLLAWQVGESLSHYPDYLAYFNQLAGGPAHGHRHLAESNLDWGQDLPALRDWLDSRGLNGPDGPPVYLSYLGAGRPGRYDIRVPSLDDVLTRDVTLANPVPLRGGVYVLSASRRAYGYGQAAGRRWTPEVEQDYRTLLGMAERFRAEGRGEQDADWQKVKRDLVGLEYNRLLAYCRRREPDETVHASFLVYRLNDADVRRALYGPMQEPGVGGGR